VEVACRERRELRVGNTKQIHIRRRDLEPALD
jgi:hypothetical protein